MPNNQVRLWEFWAGVKNLLNTARMGRLLGAEGRVRIADENYPDAEAGEAEVWGRLVIVPTDTLWRVEAAPNETRRVGFLIRAEVHSPQEETGFSPGRTLEAVQEEARTLLEGWTPPLDSFLHARLVLPIYQMTPPQPLPLWDDERGLFYLSAEFRTELASNPE